MKGELVKNITPTGHYPSDILLVQKTLLKVCFLLVDWWSWQGCKKFVIPFSSLLGKIIKLWRVEGKIMVVGKNLPNIDIEAVWRILSGEEDGIFGEEKKRFKERELGKNIKL